MIKCHFVACFRYFPKKFSFFLFLSCIENYVWNFGGWKCCHSVYFPVIWWSKERSSLHLRIPFILFSRSLKWTRQKSFSFRNHQNLSTYHQGYIGNFRYFKSKIHTKLDFLQSYFSNSVRIKSWITLWICRLYLCTLPWQW